MTNRIGWRVGLALGVLGAAAAGAQPQGEREAERARAAAERAQAESHREVERALEEVETSQADYREVLRAREELEKAARDLARLSAENTNRYQVFQAPGFAGRAVLGINVETEGTELGVRVVGVTPNGPAAAAGVVVGDTIVAIDGTNLSEKGPPSPAERLFARTRDLEPGQTIGLRVLRDGDYRDVRVQTREREREQAFVFPPGFRSGAPIQPGGRTPWIVGPFHSGPWGDLELLPLTPGLGSYFGVEKGLLVVRVPTEGTLAFREGDVILDIGGREPLTTEHALRILASFEPGETMRVTIMRQRQRQTLEVRVPGADEPA